MPSTRHLKRDQHGIPGRSMSSGFSPQNSDQRSYATDQGPANHILHAKSSLPLVLIQSVNEERLSQVKVIDLITENNNFELQLSKMLFLPTKKYIHSSHS